MVGFAGTDEKPVFAGCLCLLLGCGMVRAAHVLISWNLALETGWDLELFENCSQCCSACPDFFSAGCNKLGTSSNFYMIIFFFLGTRHLVLCKVSCKCQLHPVPWMKQEVTKRSWIFDVKGIALASWLHLFLHHLVLKQFVALMKILCNDVSLWLIEPKPMANPISAHPCEIRWISSSERLSPTGRSVG